jgi:hypothetical protein
MRVDQHRETVRLRLVYPGPRLLAATRADFGEPLHNMYREWWHNRRDVDGATTSIYIIQRAILRNGVQAGEEDPA